MEQFSLVPGTPVQQLIFPRGKADPLTQTMGWGVDLETVNPDVAGQKLPRDNFCLSIVSQSPSPRG